MSEKEDFVQTVVLSRDSETVVKFADNLELTCSRRTDDDWYNITNIRGDIEIKRITVSYNDGSVFEYKNKKGFSSGSTSRNTTFYITATLKIKDVQEMKEICAVPYQLQISSVCLQYLKLDHYFKDKFVLPGYDGLKFTYYAKKIKMSTGNDIEVHVKNPYDVEIQGKKGDFKIRKCSSSNIDIHLSYCFYPDVSDKSIAASESTHASAIDESRPESRFSDVYFISSDDTKLQSHRCILAAYSDVFSKIFDESSEIPVKIDAKDFDADTIQSAINFFCGKSLAINGKEMEVFKFAVKYGIQALNEACVSHFEESVDSKNVCEFIQIAYSNNLANFKQKCLQILVEKKKEIDSTKVAELPKNILFDVYCL
uniref:BTB domain-containing protein n=1 Tax=Panagrolaimus davidi TaxID=227884 RepID=A0A914Q1Q5_9BILA